MMGHGAKCGVFLLKMCLLIIARTSTSLKARQEKKQKTTHIHKRQQVSLMASVAGAK
ncbi:expressed unknown protein [Ectocarpus siliculosus]|uniref:Uncharacterized protein n=1 Tax=Ectocarpus siliculosus TaxID=2880 RepID=D7G831_ECTSI|nr:expressed unknown protein [Ectocarpus siliculosus]|eukprot:CBJ34014.1 expressed unknown protein [Ectocarpus siliculosus]